MTPQALVDAALAPALTPLEALIRHIPHLPTRLQQPVACQLLRASQHSAGLLRKLLTGQLKIQFATYRHEQLTAFVVWLSKHCCLLAALDLQLNLSRADLHATETAVGAALQKADACAAATRHNGVGSGGFWCSPRGLQLQSYSSHPAVAGAVLDQLDSWYLTRLDLGRHAGYSCGFALEQLTRLRNLTLCEDSADVLLGSVGALTSLTRLGLVDVSASSIPKLRVLPGQLLELQLSLARLKRTEGLPPGLALGHLTALTRLTNGDSKPLLVQTGDVLPPHLRVLEVRDVLDSSSLLVLPDLTQLAMCASTTSAAQLQLLSTDGACTSSGSLRSVSLCYGDMEAAAAAAQGWPCLSLVRLELRAAEGTLPLLSLPVFPLLTRLRRLEIYGGGGGGFARAAVVEATLVQLAAAIQHMTSLEVVGLRGFGLLQAPPDVAEAAQAASPRHEPASLQQAARLELHESLCTATSHLGLCCAGNTTSTNISCNGCSEWHTPACGPVGAADSVDLASSSNSGSHSFSSSSVHSPCTTRIAGSLLPLLAALAGLPKLSCLTVSSITCCGAPLAVDVTAAAALSRASTLTSLQLSDTGLTDAAVNALVAEGLPHLRRLGLDYNPGVTAEVLPAGLLQGCTGLLELSVLRTGIRTAAAEFKARLLSTNPHLVVKSSAR